MSIDPQSIPGWFLPEEGAQLTNLVEAAHEDVSGVIIEVGSYKGRSLAYILRGLCNVLPKRIYAVDHHRGIPEAGIDESSYPDFMFYLLSNLNHRMVTPLVMSSAGAHALLSQVYGGNLPVALLLIDGDHSVVGVERDITLWTPWLSPEGFAVFHDYGAPNYPGVKSCVDALADDWDVGVGMAGELAWVRKPPKRGQTPGGQ